MFGGAVFDMDGTLIDSMWLWKDIDRKYLAGFGVECPENLQDQLEGMSFTETALLFKRKFGIKDDVEKIKEDWNSMAWDLYENEVQLKDGALELLEYFKASGVKMAIATSNSRELVDLIFKRFNLHEYFASVCTSCEVDNGKPFPDVFLKAAQKMGVDAGDCVAFEDIPAGVIAAKKAGMTVYAMEDEASVHLREKLIELSDGYFKDFRQFLKHMK